jgi:hypothetical protein
MYYTIKFPQKNKKAARAKFTRMAHNVGLSPSNNHIEVGFSTWYWGKDLEDIQDPNNPDSYLWNPDDCEDYAIFVISSYHTKFTLQKMYETNFKNFSQ